MLQTLLVDRFHLTFHHGTKELPIYELQVGEKGARLSAPDAAGTAANRNAPPGGGGRQGEGGGVRITESAGADSQAPVRRTPMSTMAGTGMKALVEALSQPLGTTVEDKTGIEGSVEYKLRWNTDELPIPTALDEQLGLRLEQKKGPVDILIIDRIDRTPTPN